LGQKFIPTPRHSHPANYLSRENTSTLPQFHRDLELACFFGRTDDNEADDLDSYNPKMYVKSTWSPPFRTIPRHIEQRHDRFVDQVRALYVKRLGRSNLLNHQRRALQWLTTQDEFIIASCNKNLGPAIIEKPEYIHMCKGLLSDRSVYKRLNLQEGTVAVHRIEHLLSEWNRKFAKSLTKGERKFLKRYNDSLIGTDKYGVFYGLIKAHKTPISLRPVISYSSHILYALGIWCDDKLKQIARVQRSYLESSFDLKRIIQDLPPLPANARLVTADARAMYTNIPPDAALHNLARYIRQNEAQFEHLNSVMMSRAYHKILETSRPWSQEDSRSTNTLNSLIMSTP
jgi:hypothetical protein